MLWGFHDLIKNDTFERMFTLDEAALSLDYSSGTKQFCTSNSLSKTVSRKTACKKKSAVSSIRCLQWVQVAGPTRSYPVKNGSRVNSSAFIKHILEHIKSRTFLGFAGWKHIRLSSAWSTLVPVPQERPSSGSILMDTDSTSKEKWLASS